MNIEQYSLITFGILYFVDRVIDKYNKFIKYTTRQTEESNDNEQDQTITVQAIPRVNRIPSEVVDAIIDHMKDHIVEKLNENKPESLEIPSHYDDIEIPDEFKCPISRALMRDPVIISDGHTYERQYIETHLINRTVSPITNEELLINFVIPNWNMRKAIMNFIDNSAESNEE